MSRHTPDKSRARTIRSARGDLTARFAGFALLPILSAVSPLVVLPALSRSVEPAGWASALTGETVGTFAAIVIAWGWTNMGPARVAVAADRTTQGRLYRESLAVRGLLALVVLPLLAVLVALIAADGYRALAVLMAVQGSVISLSFTWFAVGRGDPRSIVMLDALPRMAVAVGAALTIATTGAVLIYPLAGLAVTVAGTAVYSLRILRQCPAPWPRLSELRGLFRQTSDVAVNDAAVGVYSAVPVPLVSATLTSISAGGYASADKLIKLGQFIPITVANALQAWAAEAGAGTMRARTLVAVRIHSAIGIVGWLGVAALGPRATRILFGDDTAADREVLIVLGLAFFLFAVRTGLTRHVLFPAGRGRDVMRAGVIGSMVGIPAMAAGVFGVGAVGAAVGFALSEVTMVAVLVRPSLGALRGMSVR